MSELFELTPGAVFAALAIGYFFGAIPTAYWLGLAAYRINIFEHGSKNMGATNVHRVLGPVPFAFTLAMDIAKGVVAVIVANAWVASSPEGAMPIKLIAGLGAISGHTLSFWVRFRGGKGVATGLGIFLALAPASSIACLLVFLTVLVISGYVSLGSIVASLCLPMFISALGEGGPAWSLRLAGFALVVALFVVYKHKLNIQRLLRGEELSLRGRKKAAGEKKE